MAATGAGADNGAISLSLDGAVRAALSGLDNDTRRIEQVRLGAVSSIDAGTHGTEYFDAFESYRQSSVPTATNTPTLTSTPTATDTATPTSSATPTPTDTATPTPTFTPTATSIPVGPVTITYTYDPLYRLKEASYSTGDDYAYTYDEVGNRLTQERTIGGQQTTDMYDYDDANRLISVNGVSYSWDNNGNLLNDGVNTYSYDGANRLIALSSQQAAFGYGYDGLGDRLQQTINGQATRYAVDVNSGLPDVLSDGTHTYAYGLGNVSQSNTTATDYFLGDALGSTRQLTDAMGQAGLAESYDPFGDLVASSGTDVSIFGFAGQQTDPSGMQFLRARYYQPSTGRFLNRDAFGGYADLPQSLNRYAYGLNNPIRYTDPSGNFPFIGISDLSNAFNAAMNWMVGGGSSPCGPSWDHLIMAGGAEAVARTINSTTSFLGWVGNRYQLGWTNFGSAISVLKDTNAPLLYKAYAFIYASAWLGSNVAVVGGMAFIGYSVAAAAIDAVGVSVAGFLTAHATLSLGLNLLQVITNGALFIQAVFFNNQDARLALAGEINVTGAASLVSGLSSLPPISLGWTSSGINIPRFQIDASMAWENLMMPSVAFGESTLQLGGLAGTLGTLGSYAMMSGQQGNVGGQMTQWGWKGSPRWRDAVREVNQAGDHETVLGKIPTQQEAIDLIKEGGGQILRPPEEGHALPDPHYYPHINYRTSAGLRAAIRIQEVLK